MAGHCHACLVTCEDYRLHRRPDGRDMIAQFVAGLGCDCDVITRGGSIRDLVDDPEGFGAPLLRDLRVSVELHAIKTIYLINHEDCGAYDDCSFASRDDELTRHRADLQEAAETLEKMFPGVTVVTYLSELTAGSDDDYCQPRQVGGATV